MEAKSIVKNFLRNWILGKKELMFKYCTKTWKSQHHADDFQGTGLTKFKIEQEKISENGCVGDFVVILTTNNGSYEYSCRCIREKKEFEPSAEGVWGINPISFKLIKKLKNGK